jgi:hypothetical protein
MIHPMRLVPVVALVLVSLLAACGPTPVATSLATPSSPLATPPSSPGSPLPTAAATPGSTATPGDSGLTVTLENEGQTIALHPGDRFLLSLGEEYDWTVTVADESVVSRVIGITVIRGAQGVYEAKQAGTTTLTAVGDPPCRKSSPPCMAPSKQFQVTFTVQ